MKRLSIFMAIFMLLLLTACTEASSGNKAEGSNSNASTTKNNEPKEKVNLKLQLLKPDEQAGVTIENNDLYQLVNEKIKQNPQMGEGTGFIFYLGDIFTKKSGQKVLLTLSINRLNDPITNVNFNLTLGNEVDGYVWNKMKTTLPESNIGVLQPNGVVPVLIPLTNDQYTTVQKLNKADKLLKIENLKYETVK